MILGLGFGDMGLSVTVLAKRRSEFRNVSVWDLVGPIFRNATVLDPGRPMKAAVISYLVGRTSCFWGLGFRVWDLRFRAHLLLLGFGVLSLGFRAHLLLLEDKFGRHDPHLLLQFLDPASSSQRLHKNVIAS